jgi:hypothetical protein
MFSKGISFGGSIDMLAKILIASALIMMMTMTLHGEAQADPLEMGYTVPMDLGRTSSLDNDGHTVPFDPNADPLGIDPLMRPLDPEHTSEYLDKISGREYLGPYVAPGWDLRGRWTLMLTGSLSGQADLALLQDRGVVFGRGTMASGGAVFTVAVSGQIYNDVLYLDMVSLEDLRLYRFTLTISQNSFSGSYSALDGLGGTWTGTVGGSRLAYQA